MSTGLSCRAAPLDGENVVEFRAMVKGPKIGECFEDETTEALQLSDQLRQFFPAPDPGFRPLFGHMSNSSAAGLTTASTLVLEKTEVNLQKLA